MPDAPRLKKKTTYNLQLFAHVCMAYWVIYFTKAFMRIAVQKRLSSPFNVRIHRNKGDPPID